MDRLPYRNYVHTDFKNLHKTSVGQEIKEGGCAGVESEGYFLIKRVHIEGITYGILYHSGESKFIIAEQKGDTTIISPRSQIRELRSQFNDVDDVCSLKTLLERTSRRIAEEGLVLKKRELMEILGETKERFEDEVESGHIVSC